MVDRAYPDIEDKVVIITGAGSGIGAQTAAHFGVHGARVVIADIDREAAERVSATVPRSIAVETDVRQVDAVRTMAAHTLSTFGQIDVLINNAMSCSKTPFLEASVEEIRNDVDVSLIGSMLCAQAVLPAMIERGGGCILNVSSVNGYAYYGNEAYSAAKAGLMSFTTSIATQFGHAGVRSNAVAPGTIATPYWQERLAQDPRVLDAAAQWYPLGRVGQPGDVAAALLFLASDAAAWITGATIPVDGGLLAGNFSMANQIQAIDPRAAD